MFHRNITTHKPVILWLLLIAIFCGEFLLFRHKVLIDVSPYYPASFDQTAFILLAFKIYENIKLYGFISGIEHSFFLSTGALFPYQAVLFFFISGISRLTILFPNMIYFIALQIISFFTIKSLTQKNYFAIIMLGLILMTPYSMQLTGGIFDFRMDFSAFCLYGIFIACAMKSQLFFNRRWSFIAGFFAIYIFLIRTITITYMLGILGTMTIYLLYTIQKAQNPVIKKEYKTRILHVFLIFASLFFLAILFIWLNREALYNYYFVGHVLNNEKHIRAVEVGANNSFQLLTYYPYHLFVHQLGPYICSIMLALLLIFLFPHINPLKHTTKEPRLNSTSYSINWCDSFAFLITCLLVPLFILTLDGLKSPIVGSIMIMPVFWLIIWFIFLLDNKQPKSKRSHQIIKIVAAFSLILGVANQLKGATNHARPYNFNYQDLATLSKMYEDIGNYAAKKHLETISLSVDRVAEYLLNTNISINYYENHKKLINVNTSALGNSIFPAPDEALIDALKNSDVVIFNLSNNYSLKSPYPADVRIAELKPQLIAIAENQFNPLGDYRIKQSTYRVYIKK